MTEPDAKLRMRVYERRITPPLDRLDRHVLHEQLVEDREAAREVIRARGLHNHVYSLKTEPKGEEKHDG